MATEIKEVKERVSTLEKTLEDFIRHTNLGFAKVQNAMIEQKQSLIDFKEEMSDFKNEMSDFKNEMGDFKKEINKKWGELSNRLGTLSEDIVAPNVPTIAEMYFGCKGKPDNYMVRNKRVHKTDRNYHKEFDVVVVYPDAVFYNETKSTPRSHYIDEFLDDIALFFDFYPEYSGRKLIPIFSSLYMDESIINKCTKNKIYAMAMKGDNMDILNYNEVKALYS